MGMIVYAELSPSVVYRVLDAMRHSIHDYEGEFVDDSISLCYSKRVTDPYVENLEGKWAARDGVVLAIS